MHIIYPWPAHFSDYKQCGFPLCRAASTVGTKWSYAHTPGTKPLLGITIGKLLQQAVTKTPSNMAAVFSKDGGRRTFEQLFENSRKVAAGLLELGVKRGDRVGIYGPNTVEWLETQFASAMVGAILVNVNPAYRSNELAFALHKTGCRVLVVAEPFRLDFYATLAEVAPELAANGGTTTANNAAPLSLQRFPELRHVITMGTDQKPHALPYAELLRAATPSRLNEVDSLDDVLQFDDPINIQFTSGTTGTPKGATLTHFNILNNAHLFGCRFGYSPSSRLCIPVPFNHTFGCVVGNLQIAAHNACVVSPDRGWNPYETLRAIEQFECDTIYGTPTMYVDLLNHPDRSRFKLGSLRQAVTGGAPSTPTFLRAVRKTLNLKTLFIAYGSTELAPVVSVTAPADVCLIFFIYLSCAIKKLLSVITQCVE